MLTAPRFARLPWLLLVCAPGLAAAQQDSAGEPRNEGAPQAEPAPSPPSPSSPPGGGGSDPSDDAFRMGSPPALPEGVAEEEVWPAATEEGWQKPCLIAWQRTFEDALAVARAENRPLLVAVNMDGEIASEHFAGVRYREPETAALMAPYVCIVASVYRHTPRDYDEEGRRVACPRFGTVTCGEHIEAERELYGKYFDGRRISPRHIVLGLDGEEVYDVYYSWDTRTVFTTFERGVEGWPAPNPTPERTLPNLARSANVLDRERLERAYVEGERETRHAILMTLLEERVVDQVEVLRSAIFGLDLELAALARRALAQCESEAALELMAETLKTPLAERERAMLLDAVERIAERSPRARTLAALHGGLSLSSRWIDVDLATNGGRDVAGEYEASAARGVDVQEHATQAERRPDDPDALLALAAAQFARVDQESARYSELWLADARQSIERAERAGASGPELDGLVAVIAARSGDRQAARERAVRAIEGGLLQLAAESDPLPGAEAPAPDSNSVIDSTLGEASCVRLLELFAEARERAIRAAFRAGEPWPSEWLSDVNAAYSVIAASDHVDAASLVGYSDFLRWIGATPRANQVLDAALERFPLSGELHERLRSRLLWEGGPEGLEAGYRERLAAALARAESAGQEPPELVWFAGYASIVAAEHHRRRGQTDAALAAYARAVDRFTRSGDSLPDARDSCNHYVALARAGSARVALEGGDLATATDALLASFDASPDSAAALDGLGLSPVMTARMLQARLRAAGDSERAAELSTALDGLDPVLLEPPASELPSPARRQGRAPSDARTEGARREGSAGGSR